MKGLWLALGAATLAAGTQSARPDVSCPGLGLLPYPQQVTAGQGNLTLGPPECVVGGVRERMDEVAIESLVRYLPTSGARVTVRLGSVEGGYDRSWLSPQECEFLERDGAGPESSVVNITPREITVVGRGRVGMLYGAQTINQLAILAARDGRDSIPCLSIRDWPDMRRRMLAPTLTWYSGYNRLEGYDLCNWTEAEWKWLADWSLLHKCNAWAVCMYGRWPFTIPGHESNSLDVESYRYNPKTGEKEPRRFTHRNIRKEFFPEVIRYANERGIDVDAYIGKNSFNGSYYLTRPEMQAGGAAELLPFAPGVSEYWAAMIREIVRIGFNGFVFEDPEAYHAPNGNAECYETFWAPWASEYGFRTVADTDANKPPLGVHIEYYSWLFREFDRMIADEARAQGRTAPVDIYLISHILLSRIVAESKTAEERDRWFALLDGKQGRKVPFIVMESDEDKYARIFGGDRVMSLGGRGGSCTCAMRRIASVNNDWSYGPMGASVDYERDAQRRIFRAGGSGAMGYIFEWTNTEVFGYIAAQYLWRNSGVPAIDNDDQTGFLDYAYQTYYGAEVGALAARAIDASACVNEAMILDGVHGAQFPETGKPLNREFQYLAAQADRAWELAREAYHAFTGREPDLLHQSYDEEKFAWDGYDAAADKRFKTERLRLLCVSAKRCQRMCDAALAHRLAQRLLSEGTNLKAVLSEYDRAIAAARENQLLYQENFDDDYDATDGLCVRVTDALQALRDKLLVECGEKCEGQKSWLFDKPGEALGWTSVHDAVLSAEGSGALALKATGPDPYCELAVPVALTCGRRTFVEIHMTSSKAGEGEIYWSTNGSSKGAYRFSQSRMAPFRVYEGSRVYRVFPSWNGSATGLRIDVPDGATVSIDSIRVLNVPDGVRVADSVALALVPQQCRESATNLLSIPWTRLSDILPKGARPPTTGTYLCVDLGLDHRPDYYRLGVTYTVQVFSRGEWRTVFRRSVDRRTKGWEHWEILLPRDIGNSHARLRLQTDSYSRAQDPNAPSWNWAIWGSPQIVRVGADGRRRVLADLVDQTSSARAIVCLDSDGVERPFDGEGTDSTGARFHVVTGGALQGLMGEDGEPRQWIDGFADWVTAPPHLAPYRSYLGVAPSGWIYAGEGGRLTWTTDAAPESRPTTVAFIAGTDYSAGEAEIECNGERVIGFEMAAGKDSVWREGDVELRYIHGGDTRDATTTYGLSGVYLLKLPASMVKAGEPLKLEVKLKSQAGWFMVHGYHDVLAATADAVVPEPSMPAIAAFTPHESGRFGVTIGEYDVRLPR